MSNPAFKFDHVHIISEEPKASAEWYAEMFGATIAREGVAYGAAESLSNSAAWLNELCLPQSLSI